MSQTPAKAEARDAFPHLLPITTRWHDNDVYGHVNNIVYYGYFDTVINRWLIEEGGLDIHSGSVIGLCVESHCNYFAAVAFPQALQAGLRVAHLGRSSVRYEIGIFVDGVDTATAMGHFVHVFVDRETRKPSELPQRLRASLQRLQRTT
jgi:acyl-CoA thioester hydrolase